MPENGYNFVVIVVPPTFVLIATNVRMWQNKQQRSYPALAQVGGCVFECCFEVFENIKLRNDAWAEHLALNFIQQLIYHLQTCCVNPPLPNCFDDHSRPRIGCARYCARHGGSVRRRGVTLRRGKNLGKGYNQMA